MSLKPSVRRPVFLTSKLNAKQLVVARAEVPQHIPHDRCHQLCLELMESHVFFKDPPRQLVVCLLHIHDMMPRFLHALKCGAAEEKGYAKHLSTGAFPMARHRNVAQLPE